MKDEFEGNGISRRMKLALYIFERAGAPVIFALLCFWYMTTTARDLQKAVEESTKAFREVSTFLVEFTHDVKADHKRMIEKLAEKDYKTGLIATNEPGRFVWMDGERIALDERNVELRPVDRYSFIRLPETGKDWAPCMETTNRITWRN